MNKKALSIIGVSCLGAVLFAGSMLGGSTAEAGLNDYGKVSEYSKMLADSYQSDERLLHRNIIRRWPF